MADNLSPSFDSKIKSSLKICLRACSPFRNFVIEMVKGSLPISLRPRTTITTKGMPSTYTAILPVKSASLTMCAKSKDEFVHKSRILKMFRDVMVFWL